MTPKPVLLDVTFPLDGNGDPANLPSLLDTLIAHASVDRPFGYRVDEGPGGYTIVPTQFRNERGDLVAYASPLDTVVTLPRTVKFLALHADRIRELVEANTGYQLACCTVRANNFDLQTNVAFGVEHESARHALQRLALLRPTPAVQHVRCQALTHFCVAHWTSLSDAPFPFPP